MRNACPRKEVIVPRWNCIAFEIDAISRDDIARHAQSDLFIEEKQPKLKGEE
jgi:hypothetical protein